MGRRLLLVEGKDDEHVVMHLCRANDVETTFDIEQPAGGGIDHLLDQVPARLSEAGMERLAVIVDADVAARSRWEQLRDRLRRRGYHGIPDTPGEKGTILDLPAGAGRIRLGIWIMPDNRLPGVLEDFLAFLIPEDDKMLPYVDEFLGGIPSEERLFTDIHLPKARIHSYLAVQKEPGKPLGLSITFRYLDAKQEVVQPFLDWLTDVLISDGN